MSSYAGTPQKSSSISLADDGSPPQGSSINPGIAANRDYILWLDREMGRAFSRFSARNFMPSNFSAATEVLGGGGITAPDGAAFVSGLAADAEYFWAVMRLPTTAANVAQLLRSRDGVSWSRRAQLSAPAANNREYRALAARGDGWVVAGMSTLSSGGAGQRIEVIDPSAAVNSTVRAALNSATNYSAAVFAGTRAYCFGGRGCFGNFIEAANSPRVVSASLAGSFVDWGNPTGGAIGGGLSAARYWDAIAMGDIVVATSRDSVSSEYLRIDATSDTVTQPTAPGVGVISSNPVVWGGKFWIAKYDAAAIPAPTTRVYSSVDGANWAFESEIVVNSDLFVSSLIAEQETLIAFEASGGGVFSGSYATTDGSEWVRTALSTRLDGSQLVASTALRSALLRQPGVTYAEMPANLRISLGGLL